MHYRARTYDPAEGRFKQRDPLRYSPGFNLYQYALGSPSFYIDPAGTTAVGCAAKGRPCGPPYRYTGYTDPVPADIEQDIVPEAIFQSHHTTPELTSGGSPEYFEGGITDPTDLLYRAGALAWNLAACRKNVTRATIGGHGYAYKHLGTVGVSYLSPDGADALFGLGYWPDTSTIWYSEHFNELAHELRRAIAPGGYLRICSCNYTENSGSLYPLTKVIAQKLKRKACMCFGTATGNRSPLGYCRCLGTWICADP